MGLYDIMKRCKGLGKIPFVIILGFVLLFQTVTFGNFQSSYAQSLENSIVPDWIRNTAGWWAEGQISDREFLDAIKFMVENRIIIIIQEKSDFKKEFELISLQVSNDLLKIENQELETQYNDLQNKYDQLQKILNEREESPQLVTKDKERLKIIAQTNPLVNGIITGEIKIYIEPVPGYAVEGLTEQLDKLSTLIDTYPNTTPIKLKTTQNKSDANITISWICLSNNF